MTLLFYSRRAYDYVRTIYRNKLPAPVTIRKWYQAIDGEPGFTTEALQAIKCKTLEAKSRNKKILCCLVIDEMSIKKQIAYSKIKKRLLGYVDCSFKNKIFNYLDEDEDEKEIDEQDCFDSDSDIPLHIISPEIEETILYIAGAIEKNLRNDIKCEECIKIINESKVVMSCLVNIKSRGGLLQPKEDIVKIIRVAEKFVSIYNLENKLCTRNFYPKLYNQIMRNISANILNNMSLHILECPFNENHRYLLIKYVIEKYLTIKLFHIAKVKNESLPVKITRQQYTKNMLFSGL